MTKELIHLASGEEVLAEIAGKTPDGQRGFVLLAVDTGNVRRSLAESAEIEVVKRPDGEWEEVKAE